MKILFKEDVYINSIFKNLSILKKKYVQKHKSTKHITTSDVYKQSGLICIRYDGEVETQTNVQTANTGSRPKFSNIKYI